MLIRDRIPVTHKQSVKKRPINHKQRQIACVITSDLSKSAHKPRASGGLLGLVTASTPILEVLCLSSSVPQGSCRRSRRAAPPDQAIFHRK